MAGGAAFAGHQQISYLHAFYLLPGSLLGLPGHAEGTCGASAAAGAPPVNRQLLPCILPECWQSSRVASLHCPWLVHFQNC